MVRMVCAIILKRASDPVRNEDDCLPLHTILDVAEDFSINSIRMQRFIDSTLVRMATFAICFASASAAWGHPGHDAHAPQQGLSHWLLSPIHCITIVCGIAITANFLLRYRMMAGSVKVR